MIDDNQPEDLVLMVLLDGGQLTHYSSLRREQNLAMPEKFELVGVGVNSKCY